MLIVVKQRESMLIMRLCTGLYGLTSATPQVERNLTHQRFEPARQHGRDHTETSVRQIHRDLLTVIEGSVSGGKGRQQ